MNQLHHRPRYSWLSLQRSFLSNFWQQLMRNLTNILHVVLVYAFHKLIKNTSYARTCLAKRCTWLGLEGRLPKRTIFHANMKLYIIRGTKVDWPESQSKILPTPLPIHTRIWCFRVCRSKQLKLCANWYFCLFVTAARLWLFCLSRARYKFSDIHTYINGRKHLSNSMVYRYIFESTL